MTNMKRTLLIAISAALVATAASARHPEVHGTQSLRTLAHELQKKARHVHRSAERSRHHFGYREEAALRALHDLQDRARHFHRRVEKYYEDPHHIEHDYNALAQTYYRATQQIRYLHADSHIHRDFEPVARLMAELNYYYGDDYYDDGPHGSGYRERGHHRGWFGINLNRGHIRFRW